RLQVLAPIVRDKKGTQKSVFEKIKKAGFVRVQVDGQTYDLEEVPELDKNKKYIVNVVVDRIIIKEGIRSRLFDSF
ncbi:excinuclease ABC subunit A, partial [Coprococcus eutactus]|nr:excinuclease ABC subunit A [Coprococcus eutactus]